MDPAKGLLGDVLSIGNFDFSAIFPKITQCTVIKFTEFWSTNISVPGCKKKKKKKERKVMDLG